MVKFIARRLIALVAVVLMVTVVTWICIHGLRPEAFQFDQRPTLEQLGDYLVQRVPALRAGQLVRATSPPVSGMLREGLPADLWLLVGGMAFGLLFGLTAGAYVGSQPRGPVSRAIEAVSMFFLCAPVYVVGLSALLLFGSRDRGLGHRVHPGQVRPVRGEPAALAGLDDRPVDRRRPAAGGRLRADDEQLDARGPARGVRPHRALEGHLATGACCAGTPCPRRPRRCSRWPA